VDHAADEDARRARSARFATMPIVLAGTIAVTAGLTGPVAHAEPRHHDDDANKRHVDEDRNVGERPVFGTAVAHPAQTTITTVAATAKAPSTYTVRQGDTVSGIAARYGLSAQEVLVRNGLGWNTIIHPGQTLHLTSTPAAAPVAAPSSTASTSSRSYHVKQGDTVSGIAARVGVSTNALLTANKLTARSYIYPWQTLRVPSAVPAPPQAAAPVTVASSGSGASSSSSSRSGSVKISTGDTVASIAAAHGVSVKALLSANGLTYTSTIYAGKTLLLPGSGSGSSSTGSSGSVSSTPSLSAEQRANAATIVSVGRSLGVPDRGIVIALAAALQESSLRNLSHGDRDSIGLFQQRPSQGWGSKAALHDPATATRLFFEGNPGKTRGLLGVRGWSSMSVTDAAQAVQVSAYPTAYAKWESTAKRLLASL
jgi:N-acetylmuramoyl-L-alanine amidase